MTRTRGPILVLMLALLAASGCRGGTKDQPSLGQVSGKVTLDGEPLTDAIIHFVPTGGRESIGLTDKNGAYILGYLPKVNGAKLGKHTVVIKTFWNDEASPEAMYSTEKIPEKYNVKTELTREVKPGSNVFDFELTTK